MSPTEQVREALECAKSILEDLHNPDVESNCPKCQALAKVECAITALAALSQQAAEPKDGEPVAVVIEYGPASSLALKLKKDVPIGTPLYASPQVREVSEEELSSAWKEAMKGDENISVLRLFANALLTRATTPPDHIEPSLGMVQDHIDGTDKMVQPAQEDVFAAATFQPNVSLNSEKSDTPPAQEDAK